MDMNSHKCEGAAVLCTSLDGSFPSLIEGMLSVSQPRLGPDHHGDLQLVRTLPLGKHRVKVVCYLKHRPNRIRAAVVYGNNLLSYSKHSRGLGSHPVLPVS